MMMVMGGELLCRVPAQHGNPTPVGKFAAGQFQFQRALQLIPFDQYGRHLAEYPASWRTSPQRRQQVRQSLREEHTINNDGIDTCGRIESDQVVLRPRCGIDPARSKRITQARDMVRGRDDDGPIAKAQAISHEGRQLRDKKILVFEECDDVTRGRMGHCGA